MKVLCPSLMLPVLLLQLMQLLSGSCIFLERSNALLFLNPQYRGFVKKKNPNVILNGEELKKDKSFERVGVVRPKAKVCLSSGSGDSNISKGKVSGMGMDLLKKIEKDINGRRRMIENYFDNNVYIEENKIENAIKDVELSKEEICMLYEDMYLGRFFENLVAKLYYNKRVHGFVHLYNGQEAISSGIIKNLRNSDFVVSTYRDHVHALSKNVPPEKVLNELYGNYYGSTNKGKGGSMHIFSKEHNFIGGFAFIGEQIPIGVGLAYSILYKENFNGDILQHMHKTNTDEVVSNINTEGEEHSDTDVVVCFLGDGTANIGQFYESLNLASAYNLPIIFVVENNNWAIGMENSRSTMNDLLSIYAKGKAFNMDTYKVNGNDVLSIYKLAKKKIKEIREKKTGPVLIEAITYRLKGHSLADPDELRKTEEKSSWKKMDPLTKLMDYMKHFNIVDASYFESVKLKTQNLLKHIEKNAEENKLKKINVREVLMDNVFAPFEHTPFQENYYNYKKNEELSNEELENYYKAFIKEQKRKIDKQKIDPTEMFKEKSLPLIID